ncbi:MAG: hypothetical protein HGB19_08915 [Chlorobiales bacterium]|nr:hypothetical protein [Chlorobiales bacterium]
MRTPTVEISYGFPSAGIKDTDTSPVMPGRLEVSLGLDRQLKTEYGSNILDYAQPNLFIGYFRDAGAKTDRGEVSASLWRFGLGAKDGFSYRIGDNLLTLSCNSAWVWSRLSLKETPSDSASRIRLARFDGRVKYGTVTEAGITYQFGSSFGVGVGFERALVYPNYVFLEVVGSSALQFAAHQAAGYVVKAIFSANPTLGPIAHFILKNGLNIGLYELRRSNVNWPFRSARPLFLDSATLTVTIFL